MIAQTFSPTDLGVPSSRWRKYTAHHLEPFVKGNFNVDFDNIFFRRRMVDGSIYLDAIPEAVRDAEMRRIVGEQRHGRELPAGRPCLEDTLTPSQYVHLEGALLYAKKKNIISENGGSASTLVHGLDAEFLKRVGFANGLCFRDVAFACLLCFKLSFVFQKSG